MYYEKIFKQLNRHRVRYLVAGGVAVVLHGVVRLTVDLDIFVDLIEENIKKFSLCMHRLGYRPKIPVKIEELGDPLKRKRWIKEKGAKVFSLFHLREHTEHIDIFIYEPISFKEAYKNRRIIKSKGIIIPVVSLPDLIKMKKLAGRPQDLADIQALKDLSRLIKR